MVRWVGFGRVSLVFVHVDALPGTLRTGRLGFGVTGSMLSGTPTKRRVYDVIVETENVKLIGSLLFGDNGGLVWGIWNG